ncbi:hypothetical protein N0V93_004048 [Gnomoniopsis smithogilvyi]|uniref:Uncharacterized protein n=1 Tax=Gnomoniopsis smithogilvyi TaxID=1191159 RepID=A0A9W9D0L6_9PEZI|nr:hypothetical protein N0V93_004048 [Gnomoniopsis smithogilvyi]
MASDKATQTIISCFNSKPLHQTTEADPVLNKDQPSKIDEFQDVGCIKEETQQKQKVVRFKLDPPTGFPFLKLPAEARNLVYDSYLISRPIWGWGPDRITLLQPALTRVNRMLRKETLEMFYAGNSFKLYLEAFNPSIEISGEEHQRLRLLRGLRALKRNGYFTFIGELQIYLKPCLSVSGWTPCRNASIELNILHLGRIVAVGEEGSGDFLHNGKFHNGYDRLDTKNVDWNSFEAVYSTIEEYKQKLIGALEDPDADDIIPSGRLSEVLQILLGESELVEAFKWVVFVGKLQVWGAASSYGWDDTFQHWGTASHGS